MATPQASTMEQHYCRWCGELRDFGVQLTLDGGAQLIGPECRIQSGSVEPARCEPLRQISRINLDSGRKRYRPSRGKR